jgi:hypothetical protein
MKDIAYPRLMFAFFFVQSILLAHGFETFLLPYGQPLPERIPRLVACLAAVLLIVSLMIFVFCLFHHMITADFEDLLEVLQNNQNMANWWAKSQAHFGLTLETLSFLFKKGSEVMASGALKWLSGAFFLFVALRPNRKIAYLLLVLLVFEFFGQWNLYVFQKADIQYVARESREAKFLSQRSADERVATRYEDLDLREFYDEDHALLLHGNMPGFWNAKTIEGSALNLSPKLFSRFWALEPENFYTPTAIEVVPSKIYDLMGLNYLLSSKTIQERSYRLVLSGDYYQIYKNMNALPRFYFSRSIWNETESAIGAQIQNAAWSPADVTLIESDVPADWIRERRIAAQREAITTLGERYNSIRLRTQSESSEFLATTEAYHSNWKVYVDGKKGNLVKINYYFRGVFLGPGEHEVEFRYEDPYFMVGAGITFCFLIFFIFVVMFERTKSFILEAIYG